MTALGAAAVLTSQDVSKRVLDTMLGFAGGAMIFVVVEGLVPESQCGGNMDLATMGAIIGLTAMMILDIAFG
jgi:ZIP family zinc transporter